MKISAIHEKYSVEELSFFPCDGDLRYEIFSPLIKNLYQNKIIYHERFTCIVTLKELLITPKRFSAMAHPFLKIEKERPCKYFPKKSWRFGAVWSWVTLGNTSLNSRYAGWRIWCEPDKVKEVETLLFANKHEEALKLTLYESE